MGQRGTHCGARARIGESSGASGDRGGGVRPRRTGVRGGTAKRTRTAIACARLRSARRRWLGRDRAGVKRVGGQVDAWLRHGLQGGRRRNDGLGKRGGCAAGHQGAAIARAVMRGGWRAMCPSRIGRLVRAGAAAGRLRRRCVVRHAFVRHADLVRRSGRSRARGNPCLAPCASARRLSRNEEEQRSDGAGAMTGEAAHGLQDTPRSKTPLLLVNCVSVTVGVRRAT